MLSDTGAIRVVSTLGLHDDFNVQAIKPPTRQQIRAVAILGKGKTIFWDLGVGFGDVTSGSGTFGEFQRAVDTKFGKVATKTAMDAVSEELIKPISAEDPQRDIGGQGTGEESPANAMAQTIDEPDKQYNHPFGLGMNTEPESVRYASALRDEIATIEKRASVWTANDVEMLQALRMELHLFAKTAERGQLKFHDQPDKLPPRDDMKSHIDKTQLDPDLKRDKKERKNPATERTPVPLPPTAKIEGTPPTSAAPLNRNLMYRTRFATRTITTNGVKYLIRGSWTEDELKSQFQTFKEKYPTSALSFDRWLVERGKVYVKLPKNANNSNILYHGTSSPEFTQFKKGLAYFTNDPSEAQAYANNPIIGGGRGVGTSRTLKVQAENLKAAKDINAEVEQGMMAEDRDPDEIISEEAEKAKEQGFRYLTFSHPGVGDKDILVTVSLYPDKDIKIVPTPAENTAKTASDPDAYWVELVDDQKDKAKAEFLSHPDIKQIAQDNGWTMEEAWENVGRDFANEFHNPANRFFASAHAKSTWWDEPSENPFAKGMTKGQRIMEWLDGNRISQEAGKYVFWHATPVQGGAGDIIRKGSYLATDPETAWHQASRDHGPKSGGIKIAKVLLAPEEVVPAGVWTKLGVDYPVAKWDITRPAAKFN